LRDKTTKVAHHRWRTRALASVCDSPLLSGDYRGEHDGSPLTIVFKMGMLYCCQKKHKLIDVIILAVIGMDSLSSHLIISPLYSDRRATSNKDLVIRRLKVAKGSQKRIFVVFFLFFRRATKFVLTNWPMLIF